jgi:branched-subunit amino acid ABC-type transport system permease component
VAYFAMKLMQRTDSHLHSVPLAAVLTCMVGALIYVVLIHRIDELNHLNLVVPTFVVILIANDLVK